jgi:hypothetical protein
VCVCVGPIFKEEFNYPDFLHIRMACCSN